uniref:RNA helicase n=1 Tax=Mucochytrium quahogii TaxID=96639 RepID=A0A7S2RMD6_9STRA|mmetsp:Transcript_8145/g.13138  ORF Transcript_8145/g.13138 Transcript_8145/m.13138 type:complete len:464 (+) Transcript_8145:110-1501(+)
MNRRRSRSSGSETDNSVKKKKIRQEPVEAEGDEEEKTTFEELNVNKEICKACNSLGWKYPTEIQKETIPHALEGRDIIGLAETGSGKTGAFSLPILSGLLREPTRRLYAIILAPTRELAFQIHEVIQALGSSIGAKSCCIVGGVDRVSQAMALARKPHVVIGTPGRVVDHLENTKGFSLDNTKVLVLDEADRMLSMDFEEEINGILQVMPPVGRRQTFLFSATMTNKVAKLQRASLKNPVKCEVSSSKYQTVKTLVQQYMFFPAKYKDTYLAFVLNELAGQTAIIFTSTCHSATRVAMMLRMLGIDATALHGQMIQTKRLGALNKFKSSGSNVLVATDVAARGLDIPSVDLVVNYDVPTNGKDYIHRVGRTARAGKSGRSVTMVTQYDLDIYQRIEAMLDKKLDEFPATKELVMVMHDQVSEAARQAMNKIREEESNRNDNRKGRGGGGKSTPWKNKKKGGKR